MKILVIDVGGTHLKINLGAAKETIKLPSGSKMTAARMAADVKKATEGMRYDAVSIGYPGPVVNGRPAAEPKNLGSGWVRFNYEKAFGKPVRIINDAAMQALGSYQGGRMLFLGLGTGLGSALVADGVVEPLELAHLPYRKNRTYEEYVGIRGFERMGRKRWQRHVESIIDLFKQALQVDYVMLGGGQSKKLKGVPRGARLGDNANAIIGGIRLWTSFKGKGAPVSVKAVRRKKRRAPAPAETTADTAPEASARSSV
jgi:polyphosphate glucokinase